MVYRKPGVNPPPTRSKSDEVPDIYNWEAEVIYF
jgi:hypothetical protein